MSNKPPNPLEEIQKQLKELFKDSNVKISAHEFPEDDPFRDKPEEVITDSKASTDEDKSAEALENIRNFQLKPKEIRDHLNRFVIRQDDAKKVLSVAICDHYNHVRATLSGKNSDCLLYTSDAADES